MSEQCINCERQIAGIYHCMACCTDLNSAEELRQHTTRCGKAVFLNPLMEK